MFRRLPLPASPPPILERFGVRSRAQVARDLGVILGHLPRRDRFAFDLGVAGFLRPDLSLPAYAGLAPADGIAPIFHYFDRVGGGRGFSTAITRRRARDFRGGRLTYDEHDGTDFVCPPGTPLACAAPGVLVAVFDRWLRGGLTACVDHGAGVVTQYTHLSGMVAEIGQPLARGETVGLSGFSGIDMTLGFPWVPPHVHFMVFVRGEPVDPYRAAGEAPRPGAWLHGNDPRTAAEPLADDAKPPRLADLGIDPAAVDRLVPLCHDPERRAELERAPSDAARAALLEDSLHHERHLWPAQARGVALRAGGDPASVRLTLPLPAASYRAARPVDAPWTRPADPG